MEDRYEQALSRAKEYYAKLGDSRLKREIEEIFPELRDIDDERIRKEIVSIVEQYGRICKKEGDPCLVINECIDWLERKASKTWKPNKEQLQALNDACNVYMHGGCGALNSLYYQLKNL